jgi:iron complex transport system ATP-binding protein
MTLRIRNLSFRLKKRTLIEKIDLDFQPGILYGILGPNGSGKSTLLKTITGLWHPTEGELYWENKNLLQFSQQEKSRTLTLVPQTPPLYFDFEVHQMVAMGRYSHGCRTPEALEKVDKALRLADAWHLRHQMVSQLSGGEKQRVYIARALATEAPILLLDEPTTYLDLRHQLEIWHLLKDLSKKEKVVITAVHDLNAAKRYCDELVILHKGRCKATGSHDTCMTPEILQDVFGVEEDCEGLSGFKITLT